MNPFIGNILWGPFPVIPARRRMPLKTLKIYELPTTNVSLSATSVDYGISRCIYCQLPKECYITLRVNQSVPAGGENVPVTVVTPTSGSNTNAGGSSSGESKTNITDHNGNSVTGADLAGSREVFAYLNKELGIIKFVNFQTGSTAAPTGDNAPAAVNIAKSK